jgi:hypothetical protein
MSGGNASARQAEVVVFLWAAVATVLCGAMPATWVELAFFLCDAVVTVLYGAAAST